MNLVLFSIGIYFMGFFLGTTTRSAAPSVYAQESNPFANFSSTSAPSTLTIGTSIPSTSSNPSPSSSSGAIPMLKLSSLAKKKPRGAALGGAPVLEPPKEEE